MNFLLIRKTPDPCSHIRIQHRLVLVLEDQQTITRITFNCIGFFKQFVVIVFFHVWNCCLYFLCPVKVAIENSSADVTLHYYSTCYLLHGLVEYSILIGQFRTRDTLLIQNRQTTVKDLLTVVKDAHICTKKSGRFICIQFGFELTRQERQESSGEVTVRNPPFYAAVQT